MDTLNGRSVSRKSIKSIFKKSFKGEISDDSCAYIFNFFLNIIFNLNEIIVIEFNKHNQNRIKHGLPRLKRLDKYVVKQCLDKIIKQYVDNNVGNMLINDDLGYSKITITNTKSQVNHAKKEVGMEVA